MNLSSTDLIYIISLPGTKLSSNATKIDEYWGALLGRGGYIYENGSEIEWCKEKYNLEGWALTEDLDKVWNSTNFNKS